MFAPVSESSLRSLVSVAVSARACVLWSSKSSNELANLVAAAMVNCNADLGPVAMSASSHAHRTGRSRFAMVAGNWCSTELCVSSAVCRFCTSMVLDLKSPLLKQSCVGIGRPSNDGQQEHVGCVCTGPVPKDGCPSDARTRPSWQRLVACAIADDELQSPLDAKIRNGSTISDTSKITKVKERKKTM